MTYRVIDILAPSGSADSLLALAEQHKAIEYYVSPCGEQEPRRCVVRILCETSRVQVMTDAAEQVLGKGDPWRIVTLPVESFAPKALPDDADEPAAFRVGAASREEIYEEVARNARLDSDFLILTVLSAVVASIGLLKNNVAIIIGAMVIAPLLGPNLAFALGTALGDQKLMLSAIRTNAVGLGLTISLGVVTALFWVSDVGGSELASRTTVGYGDIALALASGAAAVLSLVSGLSSTLVGVMVAVALMPPAVTFGIMLGAGEMQKAMGAITLLSVNVVCVNLAAQTVFVSKAIRPRTWWEKQASKKSVRTNFAVWLALLGALAAAIAWLQGIGDL
ncbi:TIGR00341 family protein [Emcibacter sp. SYSU 3D8]|uniref:TIGR00341 family protein n=1 Tax=Emcibacter sp. SYSU 3D8 TaxID=3133969 RepID=UPI0031FEA9F3